MISENSQEMSARQTVADAMSRAIVVRPETPLNEAIQILAERRISGLPVVDDAGQLVGIISETDGGNWC